MGKMTKAVEEIAEKLVGASVTELPAVTAADAGMVLTVNAEGKWVAAAIPSQLPTVDKTTDAGKVLTVNSDGEWAAAALPE